MSSWYESTTIRSLDTETTGVDPFTARIVTAAIVDIHPKSRPETTEWILDPGVDIAPEATEIHGYTREQVLALVGGEGNALRRTTNAGREQIPADVALFEIAMHTAQAMSREIPLVVANAPFDLTLLETELTRQGIDTLASRPAGVRGVVDPMVIDRAFDTYRKSCYKTGPNGAACDPETGHHECGGCRGSSRGFQCGGCGVTDRKLESLCKHYGVTLVAAHDAAADALAAARLSVRLGGLWRQITRWKLETLHDHQVSWRAEQMDSLRKFFDRTGIEHDGCDPAWPVRRPGPVEQRAAS